MPTLELSFAVNTYNFERYIGDCLASIFSQDDLPPFEVVVVDDASTDNTVEVVRSFKHPQLRLIQNEVNAGSAVSWERAITECSGIYIARIDGDDRYRPGFARSLMAALDSTPEAGLAYAKVSTIDENGMQMQDVASWCRDGGDRCADEYLSLFLDHRIPACTVMARKDVWNKALPLRPKLAIQDWPLNLRMARHGKFYFRDIVLADYRLHSKNKHASLDPRKMEYTIIATLEEFLNESHHHREKLDRAGTYHAQAWKGIADRYYGAGLLPDARRCYFRAVGSQQSLLRNLSMTKHIIRTFMPHKLYVRLLKMRRISSS